MPSLPRQPAVVNFDAYEVHAPTQELFKHGSRIRLTPQSFRVLQMLLDHPGQLVTREEFRRALWQADTFVDFDQGLNTAIKKIRDALCDSPDTPRYIETLPKLGYRFIAPVTASNGAAVAEEIPTAAPAESSRRRLPTWAIAAGVVVLAAAAFLAAMAFRVRDRVEVNSGPQIRSLAVLPFANLSADPAQEYFSEGMTDALITDLAQTSSLKVISRTSSMQYKQTKKSLPEIASELKVDGIVEGTVQRSGDRVRVTAQLIQGVTDKHLWAKSYEGDVGDVFGLQREVTEDIVHHVQEQLTRSHMAAAPLALPRAVDAKVLDAYFQGHYHLRSFGQGGGDDEKREAAKYFQTAIDADANFAPAYNGLANSYWELLWPSKQDAEIATKAANQSVMLDPNFSEAHRTLGDMSRASWNWSKAEYEYRRAIAINPSNADAHDWLGHLLDATGRLDEGLKEQQFAQELDPNHAHLVDALSRRGQHDHAIAMLQMMLKRYPEDGYLHLTLGEEYLIEHRYKEASIHLDQTTVLFGFPQIAAESRRVAAASGYPAAIRASVKGLEHLINTHQGFFPVNIAGLYAGLGDKDCAFYWLEQAYTHHDMAVSGAGLGLEWLNSEALFDPLRSDPKFKDLLRRVGLPDWVPSTASHSSSQQLSRN